jgi:hypothetical protein
MFRNIVIATIFFLSACTTSQPNNISNICSIFREKDDWYDHAKDAQKKWGTPVHVMMAIMHKESSFRADAKPPRKQLLGMIPWKRPSSAVGYAQALDGTWEEYEDEAGGFGASRSDFEDAIDFIGWYTNKTNKKNGVSKWNAEHQYYAYHDGHGGYNRGSYKKKAWLRKVARKVDSLARTYRVQLNKCKDSLGGGWFF